MAARLPRSLLADTRFQTMDRHDSPTVSFASVWTGLNEAHCNRLVSFETSHRYRRPSRRGWRDVTKLWPTITRRSDPRLLGVQLNRSRRSGSQPGRLMTREDLLFVVSVIWFVTLCGAVGWLLIAG